MNLTAENQNLRDENARLRDSVMELNKAHRNLVTANEHLLKRVGELSGKLDRKEFQILGLQADLTDANEAYEALKDLCGG